MLAEIFFKRLQQAIVFKKEGEMNNGQRAVTRNLVETRLLLVNDMMRKG